MYAVASESLPVFEFVAVAYITAALLSFLLLGGLSLLKKGFPAKPCRRGNMLVS